MKKQNLAILIFLFAIFNYLISSAQADFCCERLKNNDDINSLCNVELAKVRRIVDGDTVHLYTGAETIKTRLFGIDCMETSKIHRAYRQAYDNKISIEDVIKQGKSATNKLKDVIRHNNNYVYFKTMGVDRYGRLIAILYDRDLKNINEFLIESGYCSSYRYKK